MSSPDPLKALRARIVQRLVAALLLAGVVLPLTPVAEAATGRRDQVRQSLGDAAAFDAAARAARVAPTAEAAVEAFVRTFLDRSEGDLDADDLYALLLGAAFRSVVPEIPDAAFVPAPPSLPPPSHPAGAGAAVRPAAAPALAVPVVVGHGPCDALPAPAREERAGGGPRAP